jgi:hypothetical protein
MARLVIGEQLDSPPWIPLRDGVEGECPQCGNEGPHPVMENEDGDMRGQCRDCYALFTVRREE